MSLAVAIDFDGTIFPKGATELNPDAVKVIKILKNKGYHLILHSCRCNPVDFAPSQPDEIEQVYRSGFVPERVETQWERFNEMREMLKAAKIWDLFNEVWQSPGKPVADLYIDDRSTGPNWASIYREFGG